jgi:urease accessory protein
MRLSDLVAGLAHPFNGADHILAMLAIGLWGVVAGGRALWAWPAAFVGMILVGFVAAIVGLNVPFVEPAIACSIVVLGLLVALAARAPVWLGAVIAGAFAFFHGHAHGTEAAMAGAGLIEYATGFSLATAALHGCGLAGGFMLARSARGESLLRATGGVVAVSGLVLMAGIS